MAERDKLDIYTKGTVCWFKDSENGYISGTLANITIGDKVRMTFTLENNTVCLINRNSYMSSLLKSWRKVIMTNCRC